MKPILYARSTGKGPKRWYVKIKVPQELQQFHKTKTGKPKQEIAKSLETTDRAEALRKKPHAAREIIEEMFAPIDQLAGQYKVSSKPLRLQDGGKAVTVIDDVHPELEMKAEEIEAVAGYQVAKRFYERASNSITVESAPGEYLQWNLKERVPLGQVKEKTLRSYVAKMEVFAGWWHAPGSKLGEVTEDDTFLFVEHLREQEGLSNTTVRSYLSAMHGLWDWARLSRNVKHKGAPLSNVWQGRTGTVPKGPRRKTRAFSPRELDSILASVPVGEAPGDLVRLGLYTGARVEELCTIKVRDVSLDEEGAPDGVHFYRTKQPEGWELVPVTAEIPREILTRRVAKKDPGDYLFDDISPGEDNRSHNITKAINRRIKKALPEQAGESKTRVSMHSTRATFTTCADQSEASIKAIKRLRRDAIPDDWARTYSEGSGREELTKAVRATVGLLEARSWDMRRDNIFDDG